MIDLYLDVFRTEARIELAGGAGRVLISPFSSQQPASSHVRYHMPPRFSKEVVRGIRHAAAKAFQVSLKLTKEPQQCSSQDGQMLLEKLQN